MGMNVFRFMSLRDVYICAPVYLQSLYVDTRQFETRRNSSCLELFSETRLTDGIQSIPSQNRGLFIGVLCASRPDTTTFVRNGLR
jgi:hypothetical protein